MRLRNLRTQILAYLDLVRWTALDAFRPLPWSSATMVGGGFAALALQVNAVALAVLFARNLSSSTAMTLGPITLSPRDSARDTVIVAAGILVSMLLSTAARYAARLAELRIRERYADRCWTRGVRLVRGERSAVPGPIPYHLNEIQRLVRSDSILCSRFAVLLLQSVSAGVKLLLASAVLVAVDPILAGVILLVAGGFGIAAYRVNLRSARMSLAFEDSIADARDETRDLLIEAGSPFPPAHDDPPMPGKDRYLSMYGMRLRTSDEGEAIGNLLLTTVLSLTVLGIGLGGGGWRTAASFLIALPYALMAFRELMRTTTSLNRFYPMVRRYRSFLHDFDGTAVTSEAPPATLRVGFRRGGDRARSPIPRVDLAPGDIAVLDCGFIPDRHTAGWVVQAISESGQAAPWAGHVAVATSRWPVDRAHLTRIGWTPDEFEAFRSLVVAVHRERLLDLGFTPGDHLPREDGASKPVGRLMVAIVLATRTAPGSIVLVDGRDLARLTEDEMRTVRSFLAEHIVLAVVPPRRPHLELSPDTPALTVSGTGLVRIEPLGDWKTGTDGDDDALDETDELAEDDASLDGM